MKRVKLYHGDDIIEVHEDKAPKMISAGWSTDEPKRQAKTKKAATKTEAKIEKDD
jgi:hypothetical protein